jgi:hypothetical protein
MATTTQPSKKRLVEMTDEELEKLFALVSGSDSVELKATVPANAHQGTIAALGIDALDAEIRQVFFFDTPDLRLNKAGIAVRARRVQGRSGDTVVKLRPVVPAELPEKFRESPNMKVEVDAMPGGYVCSASMKGKATNQEVRQVARGKRPVRKLFSKEQRAFFAANAPEGLELDGLSVLGPIFVLKESLVPKDLGRKLAAELWLLPDGSRIAELSTKCPPGDGLKVGLQTRAYLRGIGVELDSETQTKTKSALELFASNLAAAAATPPA